jgi:hypothetical protein
VTRPCASPPEQAARLRTLADLLEPRILALPASAPQRAWLRWARVTIARAEEDVLGGLCEPGARDHRPRWSTPHGVQFA